MEITIVLRDDTDGQVQVEEIRRLGPEEHEGSVTTASAVAEEMLAVLNTLGDADTFCGVV